MTYQVKTPLGNVWVRPTNQRHIFVNFGHNLNVEHEGPLDSDRHGPLTIRGVEHVGSMHLYSGEGGTWTVGDRSKGDQSYSVERNALHMTEYGPGRGYTEYGPGRGYKDSTKAARAKVLAVVRYAVQEWARVNPKILLEAELESKVEQLDAAGEKIEEKRREVAFLLEEIRQLCFQRDQLETQIRSFAVEDKLQNMEVVSSEPIQGVLGKAEPA
jgi:hypothetical protein